MTSNEHSRGGRRFDRYRTTLDSTLHEKIAELTRVTLEQFHSA